MSKGRIFAAAVLAGAVVTCSPDRLRPGPPSVSIEVRQGSTVFSPDTLPILIVATDPNGLKTLIVSFTGDDTLGPAQDIDTGDDVEVIAVLSWPIPTGLVPGQLLTIVARATDLTGQATTTEATVTVIERPPAGP
ncbi:MAG: hypothetical protein IH965_09510 [Gemmatimonadetes bacterium]|nr:hypothetical protein [Gemmatimonadota bacterium]